MVVVGVQVIPPQLLRVDLGMDLVVVAKEHMHLHHCYLVVLEEVILDQHNKDFLVGMDLQPVVHMQTLLAGQAAAVVVLEVKEIMGDHNHRMILKEEVEQVSKF
jgi:hypothetical protein